MKLRHGPSPMPAEEYGRPDKYYAYLGGPPDSAIILQNGPFTPLAPGPNAHRPPTGAERLPLPEEGCKPLFPAGFPGPNGGERGGPYVGDRGGAFHLSSLSTCHTYKAEKEEEAV